MELMTAEINIAEDFSPYPSGREEADGPNNGQRFRDEFLVPALKKGQKVIVILDGVRSFGSSFFEEAFGGLIRLHNFTSAQLSEMIEIKAESPVSQFYKLSVESYLKKDLSKA